MFTSFNQFVSQKNEKKQEFTYIFDAYKEFLTINLSRLVLKNDGSLKECLSELIDKTKFRNELDCSGYPYSEALILSFENGNFQNMQQQLEKFERWIYKNKKSENLMKLVESEFVNYHAITHKSKLDADDVDRIIESFMIKSKKILTEVSEHILDITAKNKWEKHNIQLECIVPNEGFISNECRVIIGDNYRSIFDVKKTNQGYEVSNIQFDEMPQDLYYQMQNLIDKIRESPRIKKVLSLYMNKPVSQRSFFENKKREISLGIKSHLSMGTVLTHFDHQKGDLWKVKLDNTPMNQITKEEYVGYELLEDANIRWIELVRASNEE